MDISVAQNKATILTRILEKSLKKQMFSFGNISGLVFFLQILIELFII